MSGLLARFCLAVAIGGLTECISLQYVDQLVSIAYFTYQHSIQSAAWLGRWKERHWDCRWNGSVSGVVRHRSIRLRCVGLVYALI